MGRAGCFFCFFFCFVFCFFSLVRNVCYMGGVDELYYDYKALLIFIGTKIHIMQRRMCLHAVLIFT